MMLSDEVFRPAPAAPPRLGRWALVCLGLGLLGGVVDAVAGEASWRPWVSGPLGWAGVAGVGALAHWAERRWYLQVAYRRLGTRVAVAFATPLLAVVLAVLVAGAVSVVGGDIHLGLQAQVGLGTAARNGLAIGAYWFGGASIGSGVVLLLDAGISSVLAGFRARIVAAVMSLLALATLVNVMVLLATTALMSAMATAETTNLAARFNGTELKGNDAQLFILQHPLLVGLVAFAVGFMLSLPAALSACLRLGDAVMERLAPLGQGFVAVAQGRRQVRVEEGGSRDFIEVSQRFNQMMVALEMSERMERAFGVYVSGHVLERIRAQHGQAAIPAALKDASVFFADIRGFTSASEKLGPEQVLSFLNRYFSRVVALVDAHEGYLNKFIGDAVVVIFNGPVDQPDHAARAVRCALALQDEVKKLNAEGAFPEVGELKVGVGVSTGPMVCGNVGAATQMEYSVIGDTVNLAARLTSQAGPGEVWVSEATTQALPEGVVAEALEPIKVKGKEQPVRPSRVRRAEH